MIAPAAYERCLAFVNSHAQTPNRNAVSTPQVYAKHAVTISRQTGCGAHAVAEMLASLLQTRAPRDMPPWTIFDRNLVEKVLADHHLPERLAKFMPEDRVPLLDDIMDELFGLHPSEWTMVRQTSETILQLAELGNVIILGRGSNIVTAKLPHVRHIRLIGSLERRRENMERIEGLSPKAAAERVQQEDLGRARYLKKHFDADIENPLLYHLVINMDHVAVDQAAQLINDLVLTPHATTPARAMSGDVSV